jgi:hypothetical protein
MELAIAQAELDDGGVAYGCHIFPESVLEVRAVDHLPEVRVPAESAGVGADAPYRRLMRSLTFRLAERYKA